MTINVENSSKMVLRDRKYSRFLTAGALLVAGIAIVYLFGRHSFVSVIVGLAFAGAGGFLIFITRRVTIQIDKPAGKITILLQSLKKKEERELEVAQVKKIVLRKLIQTAIVSSSSGRRSSPRTYYQFLLVFVTDRDEELPFDFGKVNTGITNLIVSPDNKKRQAAEQVANFIGVPLEAALPSTGDVLSALKQGITGRFQSTP